MAVDTIATYLLFQALALTLLFNLFLIVVIVRRKRLTTPATLPASILYISLAVTDIIAAICWTLPTALTHIIGEQWMTSSFGLCRAQVWFMIFCHLLNGYLLAGLMFERFLRFYKPSKHSEIFFDAVVLFFVSAVVVFCGVIAGFPIWGFGEVAYFEDQFQCGVDYPFSESHFKFTFAMEYGLPFMFALTFYILILVKLCILKKRRAPNGDMIVEQNMNAVGDSYSDRLKELYARFKDAGSKSVKPKVKDNTGYNIDGYHSDENESYSSDEEKRENDKQVEDYIEKNHTLKQKKIYYIARNDLYTAHMYFFMVFFNFAVWVPYAVWAVLYTYHYYDIPVSSDYALIAVIVMHYGTAIKVPFYLVSERTRGAVFKTLCRRGKKVKKGKTEMKSFDAPHDNQREQTTEL